MTIQPRVTKVLAILVVSMTIGAIVLLSLDNNPPSAGAFSLSSYYRLGSIEETLRSEAAQSHDRWSCIEVYLSDTKAGNIDQLASLNGHASPEDLNCHFVVCNGLGGAEGQIQVTEKWLRQWSIIPGKTWYGTPQTIRICAIGNYKQGSLTDCQMKRIETLVGALNRRFKIEPEHIYYPADWQ